MNGSLYAVLLWLVIYLQDVLGYSAQDAGLRLAIISGAQLVTAAIAGRASERVPARWLIGPGLVLVGVGLIIMGGLTGTSDWTHLIPGFIVAGFGGGTGQPAAGLDRDRRGPAAEGRHGLRRQLDVPPDRHRRGHRRPRLDLQLGAAAQPDHRSGSGSSAPRIATMVRQGQVGQLLASLPPARRGVVAEAIRSAFAAGLNDLLIVTAALAFTGAVCALVLIRPKDFVLTGRAQPPGGPSARTRTGADSTSPARSA